ncbi:MAG TPA: VCBS repeat-containing protein [Tepidisphaeraceae bacterium]|nr:VCBS repeat-containing protein [Tepidisphaeraceae bacterium]
MKKASRIVRKSSARLIDKAVALVEPLESRAYLTGVVFGSPSNIAASGAAIAPVFVNIDTISGKQDLISSNQQSGGVANSISVLPGNGNGTFAAAQTIPLAFAPLTISEADFNGDGALDIVAGSPNQGVIGITLNNGSGTFGAAADYAATGLANSRSITVGDFNGDSKPDVAVLSYDATVNPGTPNFAVFLNNGNGTFTLGQTLTINQSRMAAITSFVPSGNAHPDLAIANQNGNSVTILTNNGDGTFSVGSSIAVGTAPVSISTADFNSDSKADLVVADSQSGDVATLLGNGDGTFQAAQASAVTGVPAGGGPLKVRVANINNDGKPDLLLLLGAGSSGDAEVMLGNGDGTFHVGTVVSTGGATRTSIAAGDLNGDTLTDLVVADPTQVTTLLNITNQDTSAPTAAVDITQPQQTAGAAVITFTVTYSDALQVDASTIQTGNLTVTDPHGGVQTATLVPGQNLGNAQFITARYQISAPSGHLDQTDNGAYSVTATSNSALAVKNANNVPVGGGSIGSFIVTAPTATTGPDLSSGPVVAKLPTSIVGGKKGSGARVVITNSGTTAVAGTIVVRLYASPSNTAITGNAPVLATVTKKINLKKHGQKITVNFPRFTWPSGTTATYYLAADVNATNSVSEFTYANNVGFSSAGVKVAPPFVDLQNNWPGTFKTPVGSKNFALRIPVKNLGNVTAKGAATITVSAVSTSDGTTQTLSTRTVHVGTPAGKNSTLHTNFKFPALAGGSYHLMVNVTLPGDTSASNDTVTSPGTFTV